MKKKKNKFFIVALILSASVALFGACAKEPETETETETGDAITVLNYSSWSGAEMLEFYDLTGKKVAEAPIKSGKVQIYLEKDGTYIVQVKDAPESVNYGHVEAPDQEIDGLVVLSPESGGKDRRPILKIVDSEEGYKGLKAFQVAAFILGGGLPVSGCSVQLCYEPEDTIGGFGYCLGPTPTDKNGMAGGIANAGSFHLIVTKDGTTIYDGKDNLSASRRFIIADVNS